MLRKLICKLTMHSWTHLTPKEVKTSEELKKHLDDGTLIFCKRCKIPGLYYYSRS